MSGKITDSRIGIMDEKWAVIQYPTKYADGSFWNRIANPTPTTTYFGKDKRYFYVLPVLKARVSPEIENELRRIVDASNATSEKAATKSKSEASE